MTQPARRSKKPPEGAESSFDKQTLVKLLKNLSVDDLVELVANYEEIEEAAQKFGPQTKQELWLYFKEHYKVELSTIAVCEGHTSQLDLVWEVYSFAVDNILWVLSRGSGKTWLMALTDLTQAEFYPGWASFCVPLDAEVLTQRGWLSYSDVVVGLDVTLGYDEESDRLEWTPITDVSVFRDQIVFDVGNKNWHARCTAGHKWSVTKDWYRRSRRQAVDLLLPFEDIKDDDRIRLGASAIGGELDVTPIEAAVLAWVMGDGTATTRMVDGARRTYRWGEDADDHLGKALIWQAKPEGLEVLRALLEGVPHTEVKGRREDVPEHYHDRSVFYLKASWIQDVARRAMIGKIGLSGFVMAMTAQAREAFLDAIIDAEGWTMRDDRHDGPGTRCFSQNEGDLLDALVLCSYLCGYRPKLHANDRGTLFKANAKNYQVLLCRPHAWGGSFATKVADEREDVWCPTTGLGTWTMRWRGQVLLTGNTIGPGREQGERKYDHILPYVIEGGVIGGKELPHVARSITTRTELKNTSKIEISLGGKPENANGPRTPRLHIDEKELLDPRTYKQAVNIPAGRTTRDGRYVPAQIVETSTMKYAGGAIDVAMEAYYEAIEKGRPPRQELRIACIFEATEENPTCRCVDEETRRKRLRHLGRDEDEICDCDVIESGVFPNEDPDADPEIRTLEKVCQGRFFRSRGHKRFGEVKMLFRANDQEEWDAEQECSQPAREGAYLKAYSQIRSGIKDYEPRPEYGAIFSSTDWGGCFDEATDVLTGRGWVSVADVTVDDVVATMRLEDERVEFLHPISTTIDDYCGPMHRYANKHIDLLVTPNHKMVVAPMRDYNAPLRKMPSSMVVRSSRMSKTSSGRVDAVDRPFILPAARMGAGGVGKNELLPDLEIASEDWAAFLGLWMAEGHTYRGKCSGGQDRVTGQVCLTHLNEQNMIEMELIMSKYFNVRPYSKQGNPRGTMMIHDVRLFDHLSKLGKAFEKRLPEYVKTWNVNLLRIYFDWHLRGDGNRNRIYTSSRDLVDDLQEIAMYAGYSADITVRRARGGTIDGRKIVGRYPEHTLHLQRVRNRPHIWNRGTQPECKTEVDAASVGVDKVYCVTMPIESDRVIYVRRNGKAVWCGNADEHSHGWYQWLNQDVEVTMWKSGSRRVIPADSVVRFAEIYRSQIGDVQLGELVLAMEAQFMLRWPGWHVKERYCDMAGLAARLNWRDQLGMDAFSRVKKDFDAEVKMVRSLVGSRYWYIDIPACPWGDKAMRAWRQVNGREVHNWASHPMAEMRYFESNRQHTVRQIARLVKSNGHGPDAAGDDERRTIEREREQEGRVKVRYINGAGDYGPRRQETEVVGVGGAADSPRLSDRSARVGDLDRPRRYSEDGVR